MVTDGVLGLTMMKGLPKFGWKDHVALGWVWALCFKEWTGLGKQR